MRTTAVKKPAVKTSCHGCSCREDALVNPCQNSRKPRQTTTPTQSGYLRSHQQVPTVATPTRATISDYVHGWTAVRCRIPTHPYVHGWTTPTLSGYLRSHPSPNSGYAQESYNLRPRQTTTPTQSGYLRSHQQVPTAATPKRATISDQDYVHGWTTPRQSGYLQAIASAQGSASQPH